MSKNILFQAVAVFSIEFIYDVTLLSIGLMVHAKVDTQGFKNLQ